MRNRILLVFSGIIFSLVTAQDYRNNKSTTEELPVLHDKDSAVWCKFQPNGYDCLENGRYSEHYYYDTKLEDCKLFNFGSCKQERNKFNSLKSCREGCLEPGADDIEGRISPRIYCRLQPDFGLCNEYHPKFYFDMTTRTCKGFSYSGCGGNLNRFSTAQRCSTLCSNLAEEMSKEFT